MRVLLMGLFSAVLLQSPNAIQPVQKGFTWSELDIVGTGTVPILSIESSGNLYVHGKLAGKLAEPEAKLLLELLKPKVCPKCSLFCPETPAPDYSIRSREAKI